LDLQAQLQAEGGGKLIDLLVETALEKFESTTDGPARPLRASLVRLQHGGDNVEELERGLTTYLKTADEVHCERMQWIACSGPQWTRLMVQLLQMWAQTKIITRRTQVPRMLNECLLCINISLMMEHNITWTDSAYSKQQLSSWMV